MKDKEDNSLVIAKRINLFGKNEKEKEKLNIQAKIMKICNHPNIIKMKDFYEDNFTNDLIIIMEYAESGDLLNKINEKINNNKYFKEKQILDWFIQICLALKHIHDRKIYHRNINTKNIFLNSLKQIKLGDFGISTKVIATNNLKITLCGSNLYISPEMIKKQPYNNKTDVWSLGVVLYELCCLKPPFYSKNGDLNDLEIKIKEGKYKSIPNQYSNNLKNLIHYLLKVDPKIRPNIGEILNLFFIKKRIIEFLNESKMKKEFPNNNIKKNKNKNLKGNIKFNFEPKLFKNTNKEDYSHMLTIYNQHNNSIESTKDKISDFYKSFEKITINYSLNKYYFENYLNNLLKETINNDYLFNKQANNIFKKLKDNNFNENLLDIDIYENIGEEYKELLFLNTINK